MFPGEYFETSVNPGSVAAALIVGFVVYILTIILREVWRQWNLRRIFSGLPEPGKRHCVMLRMSVRIKIYLLFGFVYHMTVQYLVRRRRVHYLE
jgi:hypothetical protein